MKHLWILALLLVACRSASVGPYSPAEAAERNTVEAQVLNRQAADLIHSEPARAEELLRKALTADVFFGPAHNNLGVLFLGQGKLYEAAGEFEWARKLMPGHPDPRLNLAITLERAGQTDEAIRAYETALEVYPDYLPAIQGLAALVARSAPDDPRLGRWLEQIALRSEEGRWSEWATVQGLR